MSDERRNSSVASLGDGASLVRRADSRDAAPRSPEGGTSLSRSDYRRRTFASAFEALKEHAKVSPAEVADLYDAIASHVRSASPQSFLTDASPIRLVEPTREPMIEGAIERELGAGAHYCLRTEGGVRLLHVIDELGHDALVSLTDAQRLTLVEDLKRAT